MRFKVLLTEDAERDLEDIYTYIPERDCRQKADYVLDRLVEVADSLATAPQRGLLPRELASLGIHEYRQVFFEPYRVIYRHIDQQVIIYVIADGRRDMQSLLSRRLLGA
jgi:toxin ParE1/3/4